MKLDEFESIARNTKMGGRKLKALKLVMVDGLTQTQAGHEVGYPASSARASVSLAVREFRDAMAGGKCPTCGQIMKPEFTLKYEPTIRQEKLVQHQQGLLRAVVDYASRALQYSDQNTVRDRRNFALAMRKLQTRIEQLTWQDKKSD
jgi:hypothetical protein